MHFAVTSASKYQILLALKWLSCLITYVNRNNLTCFSQYTPFVALQDFSILWNIPLVALERLIHWVDNWWCLYSHVFQEWKSLMKHIGIVRPDHWRVNYHKYTVLIFSLVMYLLFRNYKRQITSFRFQSCCEW